MNKKQLLFGFKTLKWFIPFYLILINTSCRTHRSLKLATNNYDFSEKILDELTDDQGRVFTFVGENHYQINVPHQLAIVKGFLSRKKDCLIGLELPNTYENLINSYISGSTEDSTILFKIMPLGKQAKYPVRQNLILIQELKKLNKLYPENTLRVFCFDVPPESMDAIMYTLDIELEGIQNLDDLAISQYIGKPKYSLSNGEELLISSSLINDFNNKRHNYQNILGDQFNMYLNLIEGMKITYKIDYGMNIESFLMREKYMENILEAHVTDTSNFSILIFCGNNHASKLTDDPYVYGKNGDPLAYSLSKKFNVYSIGLHYYGWKSSKSEDNFLSESLDNYISYTDQYKIIGKEELQSHSNALKRHDMIIIRNCKW